tara:strand:+ start:8309 stop:8506 length:198 start_codon:yes stop_codon:yes gene_type:complete
MGDPAELPGVTDILFEQIKLIAKDQRSLNTLRCPVAPAHCVKEKLGCQLAQSRNKPLNDKTIMPL